MTRDNARTDQVETLRLAIYHAFADDGRAPVPDVLAQQLGLPPAEIDADLHELARQRHVVPGQRCGYRGETFLLRVRHQHAPLRGHPRHCRLSCQVTPKRSPTQPNRVLNP